MNFDCFAAADCFESSHVNQTAAFINFDCFVFSPSYPSISQEDVVDCRSYEDTGRMALFKMYLIESELIPPGYYQALWRR